MNTFMKAYSEIINALIKLGEAANITDELLLTLTKFVCAAYPPAGIHIHSIPEGGIYSANIWQKMIACHQL